MPEYAICEYCKQERRIDIPGKCRWCHDTVVDPKYKDRELFVDYPYITDDEPMNGTAFWAWLDRKNYRPISKFVDALKAYLGDKHFDIKKHRITPEQLKLHKSVFSHFWWCQFNQPGGRHYNEHKARMDKILNPGS